MSPQIPEKYKGTMYARGYEEEFSLFGGEKDDEHDDFPALNDSGPHRFYGKYRGSVLVNVDPLNRGRLQLDVPDVKTLMPTTWALPCVPFAGPGMGAYFVPPPVGAGVWVEFEQGNPDKPIWVGCFWDVPPLPAPAVPGPLAAAVSKGAPATPFASIETIGPGGPAGIGVTSLPCPFPSPQAPGMVTLYSGPSSITLSPVGITLTAPTVSVMTPLFTVNKVKLIVS